MYELFNTSMYKTAVDELRVVAISHEEIDFFSPTEAFLRQVELQQAAAMAVEEEEVYVLDEVEQLELFKLSR